MNVEERFWSKVNKNGTIPDWNPSLGPCWIWVAGRFQGTGYGKFFVSHERGQTRLAHRISYAWENGSIAEGLVIDHLCHVRECVRPSHLEATTDRINILRGEGPSARQALQTHCLNGHEFTPENIIWKSRGRRSCRTCNNIQQNARYAKRRKGNL